MYTAFHAFLLHQQIPSLLSGFLGHSFLGLLLNALHFFCFCIPGILPDWLWHRQGSCIPDRWRNRNTHHIHTCTIYAHFFYHWSFVWQRWRSAAVKYLFTNPWRFISWVCCYYFYFWKTFDYFFDIIHQML